MHGCPVCGGRATVISMTGIRLHFCPKTGSNIWWRRGLFLASRELTEQQVVDVIVHGKKLRDVTRKEAPP
jgi:hypothetical protein